MEDSGKEFKLIKIYLKDIRTSLAQNGEAEDILVLLKRLFDLEVSFSVKLRSFGAGRKVYFKFIKFVHRSPGGIKIARSYFRARQDIFKDTVNMAIRYNKPMLMHEIPINYKFCNYAIENLDRHRKDGQPIKPDTVRDLETIFNQIKNLRNEIITKHLYLSLSRAKVFGSNFRGMEFEDLIQIANMGLVSAVDKYVHEVDMASFHEVAIGKMTAALISDGDESSDATIGVNDKKKLYTIRKFLEVNPHASPEQIAESLEFEEDLVRDLLMATKKKSLDDFVGEEEDARMIDLTADENQESPEDIAEGNDLNEKMNIIYSNLTILERKILILKGINLGRIA